MEVWMGLLLGIIGAVAMWQYINKNYKLIKVAK